MSRHEQVPKLTKPVPFTRGQAVRRQKAHSRPSRSRSPNTAVLHVSSANSVGASASSSAAGVAAEAAAAASAGAGAFTAPAAAPRVTYTKADVHHRGKVRERATLRDTFVQGRALNNRMTRWDYVASTFVSERRGCRFSLCSRRFDFVAYRIVLKLLALIIMT